MDTYDVIIVLGKSLRDGQLVESSKTLVQKAVDLYNHGVSNHILFAGRWSYKLEQDQPITESEAMSKYAQELGLPEAAIILEQKSYNTISNIYFIKKDILLPHNWKKVVLINLPIFVTRAEMTVRKMLGQEYKLEVIVAEYHFSESLVPTYQHDEQRKIDDVKVFYQRFADGDHQAIFDADVEYLKRITAPGAVNPWK